jgi:hypothetical protein
MTLCKYPPASIIWGPALPSPGANSPTQGIGWSIWAALGSEGDAPVLDIIVVRGSISFLSKQEIIPRLFPDRCVPYYQWLQSETTSHTFEPI